MKLANVRFISYFFLNGIYTYSFNNDCKTVSHRFPQNSFNDNDFTGSSIKYGNSNAFIYVEGAYVCVRKCVKNNINILFVRQVCEYNYIYIWLKLGINLRPVKNAKKRNNAHMIDNDK